MSSDPARSIDAIATAESPAAIIERWPASVVAAVAIDTDGPCWTSGPVDRPFALASLTKLITATTVLVAVEEESLSLDTPAGPSGSTVAHLLSHASGLDPEGRILTEPGRRRIYSNAGYELLADVLADATGMSFVRYATEALGEPLAWTTNRLTGSPASGASATATEVANLLYAWLRPGEILAPSTIEHATAPFLGHLDGALPGFGSQQPNPWGLGPEIRGHKAPHWTGHHNSPRTFGHFGRAGTMAWVDPQNRCGLVALGDTPFGDWATELWPELSDAVLNHVADR